MSLCYVNCAFWRRMPWLPVHCLAKSFFYSSVYVLIGWVYVRVWTSIFYTVSRKKHSIYWKKQALKHISLILTLLPQVHNISLDRDVVIHPISAAQMYENNFPCCSRSHMIPMLSYNDMHRRLVTVTVVCIISYHANMIVYVFRSYIMPIVCSDILLAPNIMS